MGRFAKLTNKALLPLGGKAIISHIIDKFPAGTEFVISLGYLGEYVRAYLALAHPKIQFHFVTVDKFEGPGSGPAYSLLCCKDRLPSAFYFVSCDTLWHDSFDFRPSERSWFAAAPVAFADMEAYCCFNSREGRITEIVDKQKPNDPNLLAFSGLCYISNAGLFWEGLKNPDQIKNEPQISNGIQVLVTAGEAEIRTISWIDVGDETKYSHAVRDIDQDFDFSKTDELLYFVGGRVIKFFRDSKVSAFRYRRAELNPQVFPQLAGLESGFYAYEKVPGQTLYAHNNPLIFSRLLAWLGTHLWRPVDVEHKTFTQACETFYKKKTFQRVKQYQDKYGMHDRAMMVNGVEVPPLAESLAAVPWDLLTQGRAVFFHGDLQFDNILSCENSERPFCLIDWRQDFAGHVEFGDIYYDFAKLWGGICLNYDYIKRGLFSYQAQPPSGEMESVWIDWATRTSRPEFEKILFAYVSKQGYSVRKIKILTALIYLNMSPLHHEPFDKFLFALGRQKITESLAED